MDFLRLGLVLGVALGAGWGQTHSYGQAEIEEGGRAYRTSCIGCHGGDGKSVNGVDLARGPFKRASNDEGLAQIIMNGIPNTGMPASPVSLSRAHMIVAYMRSMGQAPAVKSIAAGQGYAERGRGLFFGAAGCAGCHRVGAEGGRSGPVLNEVGLLLRPIEIEMAMLEPDAASPLGGAPVRVVLREGGTVEGFLLNQDRESVQLLTRAGRLKSLERAEMQGMEQMKSWMPSYRGKLSAQELADLIAYLGAQKGTL